ncbi:MAG TPA: DinB family protein [Streptosporangiaceae bacterium]|nr:DinB family protein [Streptosporangiaceae bacterium]
MTGHQGENPEDQALLAFLAAQRAVVLSIVAGLDEEAWHRSVVPSGWTPAGLVEHLGGAEWHWFQGVVTGARPEPPPGEELTPYDPTAAFVSDEPSAEIVAFYRDQCAQSDAVLAVTPLSAQPRGKHGVPGQDEPPDVRWIVLHMIEETARHAGHLDIARELLDGQTGLGPR